MLIKLATRGSPLAMAQARMAADFLRSRMAGTSLDGAEFEIVEIKTAGDKRQDWSLEKYGGKGLFTKEIEEALLSGAADIAVHSAKDLPTQSPADLSVMGCLPRDADRDVLVLCDAVKIPSLIASGSPRRRAQLKKMFPQAVWTEIRGNVHTRLKKLLAGAADASVLSEAGLIRLGISRVDGLKFVPLKLDACVPAVGQGLIALQCRKSDVSDFAKFTDSKANETFAIERHFLIALGGGCQAAYAANYDGRYFRFFHENSGFQKVDFSGVPDLEKKLELVGELASGLK